MLLWLKSTFQVPGVGRLDQWWESHVPFRDRVSGGGGLGLHPGRLTAGTWKMEVWFRWFSFSKWVYFLLPAVNLPGCIFLSPSDEKTLIMMIFYFETWGFFLSTLILFFVCDSFIFLSMLNQAHKDTASTNDPSWQTMLFFLYVQGGPRHQL